MTPLPLSACLIARDEAHNLPGLMASLQGVAREVVLVDTGSVDGTPELARSLGAKVLHSPWQNDFSQARNVALDAATSPWILSMDADQHLDAAGLPALATAVQRVDCLAQLVTIRLLGPGDGSDDGGTNAKVVRDLLSLRLFRRDARIRYRGRVHEDVAASLLDIGSHSWPDSGLTVTDHGYIEPEARARKLARNLRLLRQAYREAPHDLHLAYKLAFSLPSDAVAERKQVLWASMLQAQIMSDAALNELTCLPKLVAAALEAWVEDGRLSEAAAVAKALVQRCGASLHFTAGRTLARAGHLEDGKAALTAYLHAKHAAIPLARDRLMQVDDDATPEEALRWLAWIEHVQGHPNEAWNWVAKGRASGEHSVHPPLESLAIELLLAQGQVPAAMECLDALGRHAGQHLDAPGRLMPELMLSTARMALAIGDRHSALEFARQAVSAADDAGTVLLSQVEAENAERDGDILARDHAAIKGRRFDTLAWKLKLGKRLGLIWPHPVPEATRQLLAQV